MQRLKYMMVWLCRCRHSRGFGVQSPTAYWFIRYVVNEHYPYYRYRELGRGDDWQTRKLGRLYFRLSNWLQPRAIINVDDGRDRFSKYFKAGAQKAVLGEECYTDTMLTRVLLTVDGASAAVERVLQQAQKGSLLVMEGIYHDATTKALWKAVMHDKRVGVCYDLYYCGIVTFDRPIYSCCYVVNF